MMKQNRFVLPASLVVAALTVGPVPLWSQVGVDVQTKGGASVGAGQQGAAGQGASSGVSLSSADTMRLQKALKDKGHDPGPINGQMNVQTQAALKNYQQQQGLKATGTADAETQASLGIGGSKSGSAAPGGTGSPAKPGERMPPEPPASTGGTKADPTAPSGGPSGK